MNDTELSQYHNNHLQNILKKFKIKWRSQRGVGAAAPQKKRKEKKRKKSGASGGGSPLV
jgi:hypothetical protein